MNIQEINTVAEVKAFVTYLVQEEGIDFHPDTPFEDYISPHTGRPLYSAEEAFFRNQLLFECLELSEELEIDIHAMMCEVAKKAGNQ